MHLPRPWFVLALIFLGRLQAAPDTPAADTTIQIDVSTILDCRVITILKDGSLIPLTADIDGAGGLATKSASDFLQDKDAHPLPDDGRFPANERHPDVVLNYSNADSTRPQALRIQGEDVFGFPVPARAYSRLFFFCTSGWGASKISIKLFYDDHTVERRELEVPDWFWELKPDDKHRFYLAADLGKWTKTNKMAERTHHFIFGLDVQPNPGKTLVKLAVHKTAPGIMVFYGATGTVAKTSPPTGTAN